MGDLSLTVVIAIGVIGFIGGIGITAIGPGGVLPTIGLFALTDLTPAQVAGTAIVTHVATGALGALAYRRSGHLAGPGARRTVRVLALTALVGTPLGILANAVLSPRGFGVVLAVLVVGVAAALGLQRDRSPRTGPREVPSQVTSQLPSHVAGAVAAPIGLLVAVAAGIVGIGGPMLSVPLLVLGGTPMLDALAAAQVQSVVIAGTGSVGYLIHGSIEWPIAALVGLPELAGVLIGWRLARVVPPQTLKRVMVAALLAVAPYLAWHG